MEFNVPQPLVFQLHKCLSFPCVGLETHTNYDVRVLAGTKAGYPNLDDFQRPWTTGTTGNPGDHGESLGKHFKGY